MKILSGDIGGTKTRLALFDTRRGKLDNLREQTYPSHKYANLDAVIRDFLESIQTIPDAAALGLAGPVKGRVCTTTNLPWTIDADRLESDLDIPSVALLNDLEATAWGISALTEDDLVTLQEGLPDPAGNRMVIAAGTGLGQAGLFWDGVRHLPFATEGGHCDFAPHDTLEFELLAWLQRKFGHASWERAVSGPGLVNIFGFLLDHEDVEAPQWLADEMQLKDPAAVIHKAATDATNPTCTKALTMFTRLYGSETGNQALKLMATGGVFIGGGIAPKLISWLERPEFIQAFRDKGQMQPLMDGMPVKVIMNDRTALFGPAMFMLSRQRVQ
jgi:glucokinase